MKQTEIRLTISEILNLYNNKKLILKLSSYKGIDVSRSDVWNNKEKSMYINSILKGLYTPPIILAKKNNIYEVISGKQRLLSIINFAENKLFLSNDIYDINGISVKNKKINMIPKVLRDRFFNYTIPVINSVGTISEYLDLYIKYNTAISMKSIELFRAKLGKNLVILNELCNHKIYSLLNLNGGHRRYEDYEVALYFLMLETNPSLGLSKKEKEDYINRISNGGVIEKNIIENINKKLDFLFKAFYNKEYLSLNNEKYLKKSHLIIIYQFVEKAKFYHIDEKEFFKWCHSFYYLNKNSRYEYWIESSRGSTYAKSSMDIRFEALEVSFYKYFKKVTSGLYLIK